MTASVHRSRNDGPSRPEPGTARSRRFVPELEGLRGIAALMVVVNHVAVYTGEIGSGLFGAPGNGAVGAVLNRLDVSLPIFFVLSGVLLFRPFAEAALDRGRRPATLPYLCRRALRILPAYWLLTIGAFLLLAQPGGRSPWDWLRPLLVLQTYTREPMPAGMGQTWSLGIEIVFYLLLPVLAVALAAVAGRATDPVARARRMLVPLALLIPAGVGYTAWTHRPAAGPYPISSLWFPEFVGFFAVGMGIAVLAALADLGRWTTPARVAAQRPGLLWAGALAAFALSCTPLGGPATIDYASAGPAAVKQVLQIVFTALLVAPLALVRPRAGLPGAVMANPVSQFLGRISYGVFLWHVVFLDGWYQRPGTVPGTGSFLGIFALVLAGSVAVAVVSYYVVERPAMRLRPRFGGAPAESGRRAPAGPAPTP